MPDPVSTASERLDMIKTRLRRAAERFDTAPRPVELVAVSKNFEPESIRPLLAAGQRLFGENRVQEAQKKWPGLKEEYRDIELHLIGPLQSNKAKQAVALFDVIESVDREKIAAALAKEMAAQHKNLPCFIQVNIGGETQKAGIGVSEAVDFAARCRAVHGLDVRGLMCIPPAGEAPGPYFAQLALLAREAGLDQLSMGMSADFETAIAMGATQVRVGSALFGAR